MSDQEKIKDVFQKRREYFNTVLSMCTALETSYKSGGDPRTDIYQQLTIVTKFIYSEFKDINDIFEAISGSMMQIKEIISELKGGLLHLAREMGELKKLENMKDKIELLEAEMKKKNIMIEGIEQHIEDRNREIKKQMKEAEEKFKKYAI